MDLKPIGCDKTQGEDACEIAVNKNGTKVYLHVMSDKENMYEYSVENNPLGELGYIRYDPDADYDLVFPLFVTDDLKNATYFNRLDIYDIVRAEINYDGKHYVCEDRKVLADIQKGYANAEKGYGMSACPFTYVMYLTRADGTVGMVIPAMDSCKACIMGEGWYEQNNSLSMSVYNMIEKGLFQVQ